MSKELTAEEIISLIISNTASQFSGEWKPDIVYTKEELIEIVESFATKRVKEACKERTMTCASCHVKDVEKRYVCDECGTEWI